ncbi:bifunctional metallophosphatase/5'-nucleotidase [Lujinxingia vulgaris]|uniref:Bifunctional metallophosphatase/5'-nucleotidase n=1 Tax=Lujinxingia vulgaris TaxID=2600176 RepID=A0A5C6X4U1_9DELT|nr:bifunctional metallophosphatase/5'-nucleotidase [Lujinxingia vulgaris]TXD31404.1 bifunctional metallophosphatase/5'-nucleotidase [Lujinxingia vulgaris]
MRKHLNLLTISTAAITAGALIAACANAPATPDSATRQADSPATEHPGEALTVLFVADLHAQLYEHPELFWHEGEDDRLEMAGGFARVAAAIDAIKAERPGRVLVLDGGDTLQGAGEAALTEGAAIVPALNALGIDAAIPGNWEVAYGPEVLKQRATELNFPLFAANLRDEATGERLFPPYIVREFGELKVGVLGYTDPDVPERQPPAYSQGLSYQGPEELPALIDDLRTEQGADVVLLLSHIGLAKAVQLTDELEGVDVHLSSDTHERTYAPIVQNGTWVVEPGAFGSFIGRLDLTLEDGNLIDKRWELIELTANDFPEDPEMLAIIDEATAATRDELSKVVGHTSGGLARHNVIETTLDNLLSDALREATGTEIALSNGFRFGNPVLPGPIVEGDLWKFYPVVTELKTGEVTGAQIRAFWERELENVFAHNPADRFGGWIPRPSNMSVRFKADAPAGARVVEIRVGGELLDETRVYTLTACEREGDHPDTLCRIPNARNTRTHTLDAHDAVRRYLQKHPDATRHLEGRVVAEDRPQILRSQH